MRVLNVQPRHLSQGAGRPRVQVNDNFMLLWLKTSPSLNQYGTIYRRQTWELTARIVVLYCNWRPTQGILSVRRGYRGRYSDGVTPLPSPSRVTSRARQMRCTLPHHCRRSNAVLGHNPTRTQHFINLQLSPVNCLTT